MMTLPNPTVELIEHNPEVKSFIYQQIVDFEPFVTPQTTVTVVARDSNELSLQYEAEGKEFSSEDLKNLHRIAIVLTENGTSVEAEGVHQDIFQAIKAAKENLLKELITIQDSVISQQDRIIEINHYLQSHHIH
ncbi:MAG: hypothetical protein ACXVCY_09770 [Pseudobdellovibrionaceae bacterium]